MAGTYLVTLPLGPGAGPRVNKVDSILVYAGSSTDALTIAKNEFNFNVDALWAAATVTLMAAGADMTGWKARVQVASSTGVVKADVTVSAGTSEKATGTLAVTGTPSDSDTVVINSVTYTFKTILGSTAGNVLIGGSAANASANLIAAINGAAGAGTNYVATTVSPNADVSAAAGAGDSGHDVVLTALTAGTAGNAVTTTATGAAATFANATLLGGVNAASVDGLGEALVTALNASVGSDGSSHITHAAYATSTHTLTAAGTADTLGDHTLYVFFYPPNGSRDGVASFVGTITDAGSSGAALTVVLVAANTVPSAVISAQVNPFY